MGKIFSKREKPFTEFRQGSPSKELRQDTPSTERKRSFSRTSSIQSHGACGTSTASEDVWSTSGYSSMHTSLPNEVGNLTEDRSSTHTFGLEEVHKIKESQKCLNEFQANDPIFDQNLSDRDLTPELNEVLRSKPSAHAFGLEEIHKKIIKQNLKDLKDNLDIDPILDQFLSDGDLTPEAYEVLRSKQTCKRIKCFLFKMFRFKRDAFDRFLLYIKRDEPQAFLADMLKEPKRMQTPESTTLNTDDMRRNINTYKEDILNQIEPDEVADFFIMYEIIDVEQYERLTNELPAQMGRDILAILLTKLPEGFRVFLTALKDLDRTKLFEKLNTKPIIDRLSISRPIEEKWTSTVIPIQTEAKHSDLRIIIAGKCGFHLELTSDAMKVEEKKLVEHFNEANIRIEINNRIIADEKLIIKKVYNGSIVFHLQWTSEVWRTLSVDRIRQTIINAINKMMKTVPIEYQFSEDPQWDIHVRPMHDSDKHEGNVDKINREAKGALKFVEEHRKFLTEELGGRKTALTLHNKKVISDEELSDILSQSSRRNRVDSLLDTLAEKGENAAKMFLEEMKNNCGEYEYICGHLWPENDKALVCLARNMGDVYAEIITNLPERIIVDNKHELCIPDDIMNRQDRLVTAATQHIMMQDEKQRLRFLRILFEKSVLSPQIYNRAQEQANCEMEEMEIELSCHDRDAAEYIGKIYLDQENMEVISNAETHVAHSPERKQNRSSMRKFLKRIFVCSQRKSKFSGDECSDKKRVDNAIDKPPKTGQRKDECDNDSGRSIFSPRNTLTL
ncbi:hypothetical protein MAR_004777 [Mya arenaria]|uniref:CARD domain-containing protein n=1 Tax=Mya arenaria TaxID=6604 RepID=A0ABY7EZ96_MYAAR|nr:uncharacterized protein LOC128245438 isoform X2 [Mya arenaria]XP_052819538.1 uncharacterized protein LOC128245438 isoform X2 [Mya arenaria]XP_052819540.1 uncharacterized protein LOC128245438 isoform X2 [Mya arenaria]WAR14672.1 hypothetical protein MAR_004777 [Mya arenaria]